MIMTITILCLFGCGKGETDNRISDNQVVESYDSQTTECSFNFARLNIDLQGYIVSIYSNGDKLYFQLCDEETEEDSLYYYHEGECKSIDGVKLNGSSQIENFYVTRDDNIYYRKSDNDEIVKVDKNGKIVFQKNISELLDKDDQLSDCFLREDAVGNVIIFGEKSLYIWDKDFSSSKKVNYGSEYIEIIDIAVAKNGDIICAFEKEGIECQIDIMLLNQEMACFDLIDSETNHDENIILDGYDDDFYIKRENGIYLYDLENHNSEEVLDYNNSYIATNEIRTIVSSSNRRFYSVCFDEEYPYIIELFKGDVDFISGKKCLKLGTFRVKEDLRNQVIKFNKSDKEYYIELVDYSKCEDPYLQISLDMASDNAPDIMDISYGHFLNDYLNEDVLEDLSPYIEKDEELSKEDIIDSVYEAMELDGKVYFIASNYQINSVIALRDVVGDKTSWDFRDVRNIVNDNNISRIDIMSADGFTFITGIGFDSLNDFIDVENHTCSFDSDEFRSYLEFCKKYGEDGEDYYSDKLSEEAFGEQYNKDMDSFKKGEILLDACTVDWDTIQWNESIYGDDIVYIGYPSLKSSGNYFTFSNMYGICKNSDAKDAAWRFVRTFMTKDYQQNNMEGNMPTRNDCFEKKLEEVSATESYTTDYGKVINPRNEEYEVNGIIIKEEPVTPNQIKIYKSILDNTYDIQNFYTPIIEIVIEESDAYFKGDKSVDEVSEIIQSRSQIYLSENK